MATTYWQIFSKGARPPIDERDIRRTHEAIKAGYRLPKPEMMTGELNYIYENVMKPSWNPLADLRKEPQSILRDVNQLLFKVFNARHVHNYVTIDNDNFSSSNSNGTDSTITNGDSDTVISNTTAAMYSIEEQNAGNLSPVSNQSFSPAPSEDLSPMSFNGDSSVPYLRPAFNGFMKTLLEKGKFKNLPDLMRELTTCTDSASSSSADPLLNSRPASSLSGSLFQTDMSQFTSQTSLGSFSTLYSMSSIYEINNEQLQLNEDIPLGQGNFGIVYRGVLTHSNGEYDEVKL